MISPAVIVLALLAVCVLCFALNRPRMDVVALGVLPVLVLSGILNVPEALAGFSEPSVILIAAFFVIGEALVRTGVAFRVGDSLVRHAGNSETRLLVLLMLAVAGLGSVISSTGVVAIFIPIALSIAQRLGIDVQRLMMPLAFAGLMSGMLTLVGTPPNLIVNAELQRGGMEGFGFFAFTPMGLLILASGVLYMLLTRRFLGRGEQGARAEQLRPRRRLRELVEDYQLGGRVRRLLVGNASPMVGHSLRALELRSRYGANVIAFERARQFGGFTLSTSADREIEPGDYLLVDFSCDEQGINRFTVAMNLLRRNFREDYFTQTSREIGLAEILIPPGSKLIGKSIIELRMRTERGLNVMGLRRNGQALGDNFPNERLQAGDTLLIVAKWKAIRLLHARGQDFLVLTLPAELDDVAPESGRAGHALACLALTVGLMISGLVPNVIAALLGCLLLGALRCIDMDSAYRSLHWPSLMLIVGMLPFATALQKSGAIDILVGGMLSLSGDGSPRMVIAVLFAFTALVGLFISNTATAALMAPIGLGLAGQIGVSPYPLAMTVALASSAAFMTPVSSPVNTLVLGPGRYRFVDFVRLGVPFTLIVMLICVAVLPLLFPF
ncbi:MAG: SLC13 family permease [Thauera sp.]|jgi:di/tricarboxylate transporter|nr:SLC13 family permease [Thauera sp.]